MDSDDGNDVFIYVSNMLTMLHMCDVKKLIRAIYFRNYVNGDLCTLIKHQKAFVPKIGGGWVLVPITVYGKIARKSSGGFAFLKIKIKLWLIFAIDFLF